MKVDNGTVDVQQVRHHLEDGGAVILPNPAPLACVVAATNSYAVNWAIGRSPGHPVTLWVHHAETLARLAPFLDIPDETRATVRNLLLFEKVALSVPVQRRRKVPSWLAPVVQNGRASLFGVRWQPLHPVIGPFPLLFLGDAARGGTYASSAAEAISMFPLAVPVLGTAGLSGALDGPTPQVLCRERRKAPILRVDRSGRIRLQRSGVRDGVPQDVQDLMANITALKGAWPGRARAGNRPMLGRVRGNESC
jgi:hypothetical protein